MNINLQGYKLQDSSIWLQVYADNVVNLLFFLFKESQENLKNLFLKLEKTAAKVGLQCNERKTAYMFVSKRQLYPT